mgnify:CR=1 FL=1
MDTHDDNQLRAKAAKDPTPAGGQTRPIEGWCTQLEAQGPRGGFDARTLHLMARTIMGWAQNTHTTWSEYEAAIDRALGARVQ